MIRPSRTNVKRALWTVLLVSCASETEPAPPAPDAGTGGMATEDCYRCHGDEDNGNSAPPPAIWRETEIPDPHQRHLQGSSWHGWIDCDDCHVVPETIRDDGHNDGRPAELSWSGLAVADDATPSYDFDSQTCSGGYCHGATLTAGAAAGPLVWTEDSSQSECGTGCHQNPPPTPHPAVSACHQCHSDVVDDDEQIKAPLLHIDGHISVDEMECNDCHGGGSDPDEPVNWAPPVDVAGNSATSARGVGAHREHLATSTWRAALVCEDCHLLPTGILDAGHMDSVLPAELSWSALATADGATPTFDGVNCTNTYCHGSTMVPGGSNTVPSWTTVDGSQAACGTCHGSPPNVPLHPFVADPSDCGPCHAYTGLSPNDPSTHIDGVVDVVEPLACDTCHGGAANDAPPIDVSGNVAASYAGVGAHQQHLLAGGYSVPISCDECHVVPTDWKDAGHMDTSVPAELTWGTLASADGASPSYATGTCLNSYCHGATLAAGGTNTTPSWTTVDGTQAACGTCHGVPPSAPGHPYVPNPNDCAPCHEYSGLIPNVLADHINGTVEVSPMLCNVCHGSATNDAPPSDVSGNTATSFRGVGAHQSHLQAGAITVAIPCTECHVVPTHWGDAGHYDSALPADVTFGPLATHLGSSPSWNGFTCTDAYCHRPNSADSAATFPIPVWTLVNGTFNACDACHGYPPVTATHPPFIACGMSTCHEEVVATDHVTITDKARHVDGTVDY